MPGLVGEDQENQYEVSFCVTNECMQHSDENQHRDAYTLMNGSIRQSTSGAYTFAEDYESGSSNSGRKSDSSTSIFETASASGGVETRSNYSTIITRHWSKRPRPETYEFANDVFDHHLNRHVSIPPSIPELSASLSQSNPRKPTSGKRFKYISCTSAAAIVISLLAILTSAIALMICVILLNQVRHAHETLLNIESVSSKGNSTAGTGSQEKSCSIYSCHHLGGKCVEIDGIHQCICNKGWIGDGINCTETFPTTCSDVRKVIGHNSGFYTISPDPENVSPFLVRCAIERNKGVTEIDHDSETRIHVNGCNVPGCYVRNITYLADVEQIAAVIAASEHCSQYVKYECYHSKLAKNAWWISRIGTIETYWDEGAGPNNCACSKNNGTCPGCFCNMNDSQYREDEGYITNKTLLPIMQLRYGDVGESWEDGYHTVGKLRCYG